MARTTRTTTSGPRIRDRGRVKLKGLKRYSSKVSITFTTGQAVSNFPLISLRITLGSSLHTSMPKMVRQNRLLWRRSYQTASQMFAAYSWRQGNFGN